MKFKADHIEIILFQLKKKSHDRSHSFGLIDEHT